MSETRPSAEQLARWRDLTRKRHELMPFEVDGLFAEIDAVTRELDEAVEAYDRSREEYDRDITADDIIPPVSAGRVRGIALVWLRQDAAKARADLEALASWLDRYHAIMREVLKESDAANG